MWGCSSCTGVNRFLAISSLHFSFHQPTDRPIDRRPVVLFFFPNPNNLRLGPVRDAVGPCICFSGRNWSLIAITLDHPFQLTFGSSSFHPSSFRSLPPFISTSWILLHNLCQIECKIHRPVSSSPSSSSCYEIIAIQATPQPCLTLPCVRWTDFRDRRCCANEFRGCYSI